MASKGPRSKLDHETRAKRHKALEAPNEPRRPKAHWDHVLEEMIWLSKDFESERKWKLAQAKKVALRASKGMLDQATRGEKRMKEEELRLKKVALSISKDVKKFWLKIEKLVLYKHQMELDEKKKRALDKQLEFLLGQTERYSTMLAENLGDSYKPVQQYPIQNQLSIQCKEMDENDINKSTEFNADPQSDTVDGDDDYDVQSDDGTEDDECTIEEDEALFTEQERQEELAALQNEVDLPLEELLKQYPMEKVSPESSPEKGEDVTEMASAGEDHGICPEKGDDSAEMTSVGQDPGTCSEKVEDDAEMTSVGEDPGMRPEKVEDGAEMTSVGKDPGMLPEKVEDGTEMTSVGEDHGGQSDIFVASKTEKISSDIFTGRRCVESNGGLSTSETHLSDIEINGAKNISEASAQLAKGHVRYDFNDEHEDGDFILAAGEEKDDETTLSEEEELARADTSDPMDEIALLQKESEVPLEELLARIQTVMKLQMVNLNMPLLYQRDLWILHLLKMLNQSNMVFVWMKIMTLVSTSRLLILLLKNRVLG